MAWTNEPISSAVYTNQDKLDSWYFLLQELGNYLLQENGGKLIIDGVCIWTDESLSTASFTNQPKS